MNSPLGPRRRRPPQPEPLEAPSRAAARRHLAARVERLRAYAAVLEDAVTAGPPDARLAWLDRQLTRVRRDLRVAEQTRLPLRPGAPEEPAPEGVRSAFGSPAPSGSPDPAKAETRSG